jgi:macrolide transport system ATP-binding/permease protein
MAAKFPRIIVLLFRLRFRRSAEFALGDLLEEWNEGTRSQRWLWRQAFSMIWPGTRRTHDAYAQRETQRENIMNVIFAFWNDLRYAVRTLSKNPGFTAVAVFAIALGIGLNTGIFSILNGAALRSLPVPHSTQIVSVYQFMHGMNNLRIHESENFFSWADYQTYRDNNHVFSGLLAYEPFVNVTLGGDRPQQIFGQLASCNYFEVLNEPPALGRTFGSSDCAQGTGAVVVLGNDLWRNRFGGDQQIIGRNVILNRQPFTVIGVAAPGFQGTELVPAHFWAPVTVQPLLLRDSDYLKNPNTLWLAVLGRIKPGIAKDQVQADLAVIAARIDKLTPPRKTSIQILPANLLSMPDERKFVAAVGAVLLAAVGMVLLIACANVANLLLARASGRRKEIAIRLSVGASRGRLIRQLMAESMLIAALGGALGSLLAFWSFAGIVRFAVAHLPHAFPVLSVNVGPDLRVLGYALALSLLTGIVFGLAPALQASRPDVNAALKDSGAGVSEAGSKGWLRHTLVGAQVAVSMVLLIAAGLLLRGLLAVQTVEPGFEMRNIASVSFDLRDLGYDSASAAVLQQNLRQRLSALAGVDQIAEVTQIPLGNDHYGTAFSLPGKKDEYGVEFTEVSPEFFPLLKIPIVRGRDFTLTEAHTGAPVAILSESTARRVWPGQDPLGKIIRWDSERDLEVIGVAKDAQVAHLARTEEPYVYLPAGPKEQMRLKFLVHYPAGFASVAKSIRAVVHAVGPDLVTDVTPLEDNLEVWRAPSRIVAILAGSLGALGMLLACIGVYGVVSYAVSRRVREIGIRMTLGADAREVKSLILRQAMRPVVIGALVGVAGCAAVSQILNSMLFGISAHDPVAFVVVPLILLSVALLASYIPARRATQVDPMVALRYE